MRGWQPSKARWRLIVSSQVFPLCTFSASASSSSEDHPVLVRDFIHDALYHPHHGYFSVKSEAVGMLPEPISFSRFTAMIFEIGGGTGTCAKNILDYFKNEASSVYDNMQYVSVEISKALANIQLNSVHTEETHKSHYFVECRDACKRSGWGEVDERPCFVILLEVLDNQPHDLIFKKNSSSPWLETLVIKGPDKAKRIEVHQPVEDPLIQCCIKIMESEQQSLPSWWLSMKKVFYRAFPSQRKAWIPTAAVQLLEALYSVRPNLALIVSDFNVLPDVRVEGDRAPLVATKKDGVTVDLSSYLDANGDADIFFPTDFHLLKKLDHHCYSTTRPCAAEHKTSQLKHRQSLIVPFCQFMKQHAQISQTVTKDGFNPLLDDYSNMQFFITRWL